MFKPSEQGTREDFIMQRIAAALKRQIDGKFKKAFEKPENM